MKKGASVADGFVEVKFKALAGREDQAGGLVWRWKDGDNYYVARANALENNVSLYYTEKGNRINYALRSNFWRSYTRKESLSALPTRLEGDAQAAQAEYALAGHDQ